MPTNYDLVRKTLETLKNTDYPAISKEKQDKFREIITLCLNDEDYLECIFVLVAALGIFHPSLMDLMKTSQNHAKLITLLNLLEEDD